MKVTCSVCQADIPKENINVSTDLAQCNGCGNVLKLSELFKTSPESRSSVPPRPPQGSKIEFHEEFNGSTELTYPKKGLKIKQVPILLFAIVWLGFISFWTFLAAQGMPFFALFSIPFWLVGGGLILGIANSASEVEIITADRTMIRLEKKRLIRSKVEVLNWSEVHGIRMSKVKMSPFSAFSNFSRLSKMQNGMVMGIESPGVLSASKTHYFFEDASEAEQEWIIAFLTQKWENNK